MNDDRADRYEEALWQIKQWSEAYPLTVFPEPDMRKARKLLEDGGMTLDAISAHAMRHVVEGVGKIAAAALAPASPPSKGRKHLDANDEWQPIDSAPRDGTIIYACDAVRGYDSKVIFNKLSGEWECVGFDQRAMGIGFYPTHWYRLINLPAPPSEEEHPNAS